MTTTTDPGEGQPVQAQETPPAKRDAHFLARYPWRSAGGLACLTLPIHYFLGWSLSLQLAAVTLGVVAGIYLGFAFKDGRLRVILIETAAVAFFVFLAYLGLTFNPRFTLLGFLLHGLWDIAHHHRARAVDTELPRWYIPFCAAYDIAFAIGLYAVWHLG